MFTKKIIFLWSVWVCIMIFWYIQNHWLPLGYDHGAYKHFIQLLSSTQNIRELPVYLQEQFEPFSGTFFYTLSAFIGTKTLFSWWYLSIYIALSGGLFLLGKRGNKYTIGSYLGLFLFFFSVLQYTNLWWAFGKQMFATFFLILLMRYHKNTAITLILSVACIWLHRLTGFIAILFLIFSLVASYKKKKPGNIYTLLLVIILGILSYRDTFSHQVLPFLQNITWHTTQLVWISRSYGTGLEGKRFWFYITPILLVTLLGYTKYGKHENIGKLIRKPHVLTLAVIAFMVIFRCIAHTRLGSFFDLFLIIVLTKTLYHGIQKKWLSLLIVIQMITWWGYAYRWHTPYIDTTEYGIIQNVTQNLPDDVTLVTLTGAYMSWMTGSTESEIYSLYQWISSSVWSSEEKKLMQYKKGLLCKNLSILPGNVFVYVGSKEKFPSTRDNSCLKETIKWPNNARLLQYVWGKIR